MAFDHKKPSSSRARTDRAEVSAAATLKPSDVLAKAADLIEPEGAWTQWHFARTAGGETVTYGAYRGRRTEIQRRCINGALYEAAYRSGAAAPSDETWAYARRAADSSWLPAFNDTKGRTQAEVVAALRAASELARSAGQ